MNPLLLPPPIDALLEPTRRELERADWSLVAHAADHADLRRDARRIAALDYGHIPHDQIVDAVHEQWVPHESRWCVDDALAARDNGSLTVTEIRVTYGMLTDETSNVRIAEKLGRGRAFIEKTLPRYANWLGLREALDGWKWLLALAARRADVPACDWGQWHNPDGSARTHRSWMRACEDRVAASTFASGYAHWCEEDPEILLGYLAGWYGDEVIRWAAEHGRPIDLDVSRFCDDSEEVYW